MRTYDNTLLLRVRFRLDNRKKTHRNEYKELFMDENKKVRDFYSPMCN